MPPHRVALIAFLLPALYRLLIDRGARIRSFDVFFLLFNIWTVAVFHQHGGQVDSHGVQSDGLVFGGSLALESFAGYLVARAYVRDLETFRATIRILLVAVVAAGIIAVPEMLLGQHFMHDMLQNITGYVHPRAIEMRMGLNRAYGTFDHPIHLGTFCASLFALTWIIERRLDRRLLYVAMISIATLTALSSAPLLCIGVQIVLLAWERMTRGVKSRVAMSLAAFAGLYIGASLVGTRTPIAIIATGMTLDSWTGYYRLLIWEYGLDNVWANPWLGIGLADWVRPAWMIASTVDAFWLLIAMRTGVPSIVMLLLAIGLLVMAVGKKGAGSRDKHVRQLARGWIIALLALSLAACTVHFWNVLYAYFFFFLGLGAFFADPKTARKSIRATVGNRQSLPAIPAPA